MTNQTAHSEPIAQATERRHEIRRTLVLGLQLSVVQIGQVVLSTTDIIMAAWLGDTGLGAIALVSSLTILIYVTAVGLMLAMMPLFGAALGRGDLGFMGTLVGQGFWVAGIFAVAEILLIFLLKPALLVLGQEPAVSQAASQYAYGLIPGAFFAFAILVLRNYLSIMDMAKLTVGVTVLGIVANIGTNYGLMYGIGPLPEFGLLGIAFSTSLVNILMFFALVLVIARHPALPLTFPKGIPSPNPAILKEIVAIGAPIGAVILLETVFFSVAVLLVGGLSAVSLAAYAINANWIQLFLMIPIGISQAATARLSIAAGTGNSSMLRTAAQASLLAGGGVMLVFLVLTVLIPDMLSSIILFGRGSEDVVLMEASKFMPFVGVVQLLNGLIIISAGALRGVQDTKAPFLMIIVTYWGIGLGTSVSLSRYFDMGVAGIWWGLIVGFGISAAVILVRLRRKVAEHSIGIAADDQASSQTTET